MDEKPDNHNDRRFHVTLAPYDVEALRFMRAHHGTSLTAAIRVCIRAAARQLGFKPPPIDSE